MMFHIVRCDQCGEETIVPFAELGEVHPQYPKGLPGPYDIATADADRWVQEHYSGPAITEQEHHARGDQMVGRYAWGGSYRFDTPPKCPRCRSTAFSRHPGWRDVDV